MSGWRERLAIMEKMWSLVRLLGKPPYCVLLVSLYVVE